MAHLSTAESHADLDLVAALQKFLCLIDTRIKIMNIDIAGKPYLLDLYNLLLLTRFLLSLFTIEAIAAVVHNPAYRRLRRRRYQYKVEIFLIRHPQSFRQLYHAQLFSLRTDKPYFVGMNGLIDLHFFCANCKAPPC